MSSTVYKRKGSPYWYLSANRQSTKTANRKDAEAFARKVMQQAWTAETLKDARKTWGDLATGWPKWKSAKKSLKRDMVVIGLFGEWFAGATGDDASTTLLRDITADRVREYGEHVKERSSSSNATRHLAILRAMFRKAQRYDWISKAPHIEEYSAPIETRARWLTVEQFESAAAHLDTETAELLTLSIRTGMRYSNVAGLRWGWIAKDGEMAFIPATHTKNGRQYEIPLDGRVQAILARRKALSGGSPTVFVQRSYYEVRYAWRKAVRLAGLPPTRIHDLRHSFASLHTMSGTPDRVIQSMCGWSTPKQLQRYAHLSHGHMKRYAGNIDNATV